MLNRRRFARLCRFFAPASFVAAAVCFALPTSGWAQKMPLPKEKSKASGRLDKELEKVIGKTDADLFNGVMNSFGDGKTLYHLITETTANVNQDGFNGSISGKTTMRGNYGGAFVSEHELTFRRGEQSAVVKTQFVCDGKTLWTYKPDAGQYTEQLLASIKTTFGETIMRSSFDIVALVGAGSDNDDSTPSKHKMTSAHVDMGLFKGTPSRILSIVYSDKNDVGRQGIMRVYLGTNKRLRGLQMESKEAATPFTVTETIKVMETIPPPDKSIFNFSPPAGTVKVDKFAE